MYKRNGEIDLVFSVPIEEKIEPSLALSHTYSSTFSFKFVNISYIFKKQSFIHYTIRLLINPSMVVRFAGVHFIIDVMYSRR